MGWGFLDDIGDAVGGAVEAVGDAATSAVDTVVDTAQAAYDAAESAASGVVDQVVAVAETAYDTASSAAGWGLNQLDDTVFDTVDYVSGGIVNIDYDNGQFDVNVGIDGVADIGASIGENGVSAQVDSAIASGGLSYTDDGGFAANVEAGINWGPLPYVEGHVEVTPEGDISVGGEVQGTIPTPWGILSGEAQAGFDRNADGSWSASGGAEGTLITSGGVISAGGHVGYAEDADGNTHFEAGGHGGYQSLDGSFSAGGGIEYEHDVVDGVETTSVDANAFVEVEGVRAEGELNYDRLEDAEGNVLEQTTVGGNVGVEVGGQDFGVSGQVQNTTATLADGTSVSVTETSGDIEGLDTDMLLGLGQDQLASNLPDAPGGGSFDNAADAVSALAGEGSLSDVLDTMSDMGGGDGTNAPNAIEAVSDYVEEGQFDDFTSDVVSAELTEASADELWDDLG